MTSHKLERARRLLMRAVELVTGGDEETSTNVTEALCSSGRENCDASGSGMSTTDQMRRVSRTGYESQPFTPLTSGRLTASFSRVPQGPNIHNSLDNKESRSEGQRLFGFNPRTSARKRRKAVEESYAAKKKPAWSRDCICLNLHYQDWIPTVQEKISLASAGLGLKRLQFQQEGDGLHIQNTIVEAFPELPSNGEFKLLRAGTGQSCKQLVVIGYPAGMTVPYLKDIVGQAKLYIRPDHTIEDCVPAAEEDSVQVCMYSYSYICSYLYKLMSVLVPV